MATKEGSDTGQATGGIEMILTPLVCAQAVPSQGLLGAATMGRVAALQQDLMIGTVYSGIYQEELYFLLLDGWCWGRALSTEIWIRILSLYSVSAEGDISCTIFIFTFHDK